MKTNNITNNSTNNISNNANNIYNNITGNVSATDTLSEAARDFAREVAREVTEAARLSITGAKRGIAATVSALLSRLISGIAGALGRFFGWLGTPHGTVATGIAVTLATLAWLIWGNAPDSTAMCAALIVPGIAGGKHIGGEPLTTDNLAKANDKLLVNDIDSRIVKIRPMATPIDQISRYAGARHCGSMEVEYYSVDTKEVKATVATDFNPGASERKRPFDITVDPASIFEVSETVLIPDVKDEMTNQSIVLYISAINPDTGVLTVNAVNGRYLPILPAGTQLVRMGRAAGELDVQTGQFEALPMKQSNYCQIFKAQVEQSTYVKIANKEVGWTFSDQEEAAIIDMRQGMEKNFLFGIKARIPRRPNSSDEVMLTGGIWHQVDKEFVYGKEGGLLTDEEVVQLMRLAFTGQGASARKILIGGSGFIEALNALQINRVIHSNEVVTKWGLVFTELHSNFGSLYVLHSEMFDDCGHADDAMIIDPEYLTKYCHVPFRTEKLNLRAAGVRNTDAIVITEASCLVLRYPKAHVRITRA